MSDRMTAAELQESREEALWNLCVDLTNAEGAIEALGLYTESVRVGSHSFFLGQVVSSLKDEINRILDPEGE